MWHFHDSTCVRPLVAVLSCSLWTNLSRQVVIGGGHDSHSRGYLHEGLCLLHVNGVVQQHEQGVAVADLCQLAQQYLLLSLASQSLYQLADCLAYSAKWPSYSIALAQLDDTASKASASCCFSWGGARPAP